VVVFQAARPGSGNARLRLSKATPPCIFMTFGGPSRVFRGGKLIVDTEIFLPSHANFDFGNLERKQDPVQEIVVTDEEVANMFPS